MKSYLKKQRLLKLANISIVALSLITPAAYAEEPCLDETKVYEPTTAIHSANMQAAYPDNTFKGFGDTSINKFVGHTFTGLNIPGKTIVGATLEVKAKPGGSQLSNNDSLNLKFYDADGNSLAPGWGTRFGLHTGTLGLAPVANQQWKKPLSSQAFNLDLNILPKGAVSIINELNTHGFLDVFVEDDTTVESFKLTVKYKCNFQACQYKPNLYYLYENKPMNVWEMTSYLDRSSKHQKKIVQQVCFTAPSLAADTHCAYNWYSSFKGWSGKARQEGDQIFMHGDYSKNNGHTSFQWEIVTQSKSREHQTKGFGHCVDWQNNKVGSLGSTMIFANVKFVRINTDEKCEKFKEEDIKSPFPTTEKIPVPILIKTACGVKDNGPIIKQDDQLQLETK
jgi:hypothetical protein